MDINKLMGAAQAMQSKMEEAKAKIAELRATGSAGAGLVQAEVTGDGRVVRLRIDPSLFKPEDKEVVEDLIVAAIGEGQRKAADAAQAEMAKVTAGLPLPPGMKLPF